MHFIYANFQLDCTATVVKGIFKGGVVVSRTRKTESSEEFLYKSVELKSFPTEIQAIDYARNFGEMWCDSQLLASNIDSATCIKRRAKSHEKNV